MKSRFSWPLLAMILGVAGFVIGCHWMVLRSFPCDLPVRDEWKYAVQQIILADQQGALKWGTFFTPLLGHYLLYSKLLVWIQGRLVGQVDFLAGNALNGLVAATLATLVFLLARRIKPGMDFWWALFCALLFGVPHSFEGMFISICNGYLFFGIFAVLLFLVVPFDGYASLSRLGWTAVAGAMGTFSYETGYAAMITVMVVILLQSVMEWPVAPSNARLRVVFTLLVVFASCRWFFPIHRWQEIPAFDVFGVSITLNNALAWPLRFLPGGALLTWFPSMVCALGWWRTRGWSQEPVWGRLWCLILWSGFLCLSIAVARQNPHGAIYSRYEQFLVFNLVANGLAAAFLWRRVTARMRTTLLFWSFLVGTAFFVRGLIVTSEYLPNFYAGEVWQRHSLGRYLYQGDPSKLPDAEPVSAAMFQEDIRAILDDPAARYELPPSITPSLDFFLDKDIVNHQSEVADLPAPPPRFFPWILKVSSVSPGGGTPMIWLRQNLQPARPIQFWVLGAKNSDLIVQEMASGQIRKYSIPSASDNRWDCFTILLPPGEYHLLSDATRSSYWLAGGFPLTSADLRVRWLIYQAGFILGSGCLLLLIGGKLQE